MEGVSQSHCIGKNGAIDPRGPPENSDFLTTSDGPAGHVPRSRSSNRLPQHSELGETQVTLHKEFMNHTLL